MEENKIRANIEGHIITEDDVKRFMDMLDPRAKAQFKTEDGMDRLTDEIVNQYLLYLDAIDNKFDEEEEFIAELNRDRENLLKQYALSKVLNNVKIEEDELVEFYNSHPNYYKVGPQITASHILVDNEEKAEELYDRIVNKGESFTDLAKEASKCPSKVEGGSLGTFTTGQMVKEFEDVCLELEIGKISKPVKTQFGYHLILVTERQNASIKAYEEVKEQVRKIYTSMKQQEAYINKTVELKQKYTVKKNY